MKLYGLDFTSKEQEIIEGVGAENEDYAICALFEHRNSDADLEYDEDEQLVVVRSSDGHEVRQTIEMLTDVCDSEDPLDRIGVGVSMLEIAVNFEKQWST